MLEQRVQSGSLAFTPNIENTNISSIEPLKPPIELKREIVNRSASLIANTRQEIRDVLHGKDTKRLVMIVGPCSIHDPGSAIEYGERLFGLKDRLADELVIVMRTYFEKPRTTVGWTGLVYDPHLDGSSDAGTGLAVSRKLLADINGAGLPCAVEFLDPNTPQYFADLVSWGAIGARTTESQVHRQLVSGLSMPVGFKNSTEGDMKVAVDAMVTATSPHTFFGIDVNGQAAVVKTNGNPDTHIVLRGGNKGTNYDEASMAEAVSLIQERNLLAESSRPVMIDCSHGNSAKDHRKQSLVVKSVLPGGNHTMGFMIESNIFEGRQNWVAGRQLQPGISITDACIGWEETERLLFECARMVQPRRYAVTLLGKNGKANHLM